jgi:hypothetical protein
MACTQQQGAEVVPDETTTMAELGAEVVPDETTTMAEQGKDH